MMIQDDEFEALVTTPERVKALGFKPQKEILTNHILPYAGELDEESLRFLEQVKTNLSKAVLLREMKPACGVWSSRLMKYIRIYGLKFSKEDHIALIKLSYDLIIIPDLEPCKIHKFMTMFLMLTKKRHLITPDDLKLPWRPLLDLGKKVFDSNATHTGMYHYLPRKDQGPQQRSVIDLVRKFISGSGLDDAISMFGFFQRGENEFPTSLEGSYVSMVKCAKPYFEVSATKEILEELLPQLCLWSNDTHAMGQLTVFIPTGLHPKYSTQGHELWFEQLMVLWDTCYNSQCGVAELMSLFAGLAKRNPGAIDWAPYAPKMFTRFLHALNLPVAYKDMQYSRNHSMEMKQVASWIVWAIAPDGTVLKHLRSFLAGVESYLHSANSGRWSFRLRDLLRKLAREFLNRVRREREKRFKESWENQTPPANRLRDEDITEFVNIVVEPTLQAVYSRSGSLDISVALQNLATLRPAIVIPPLIERLKISLTSLTEPHRVTAAMSAVAAVARPMLRGPDADYPEGPTHVVPLLLAILPGLDPNDIKKSLVSLHFILIFSWMVPIIDCSTAYEHWNDLTEEELLTCESTAQFEDFVLVFLDRLFIIIESSVMEHARLDTKESDTVRSKTDAVMETAISAAANAVLMQCSPKIFAEALRKFRAFATETTFETNVSGSMVGVLVRVFAKIDPEATLAAFLPKLCDDLTELLSSDEALHEENPPRDILYRLVLMKHVVECDGVVLLKYMNIIIPVLDRALKLHSKYALTRASDILGHVFHSLSFIDLKEWRSSPKDYSQAPEKWLPIREWGKGCVLKDVEFKWHMPTEEEAKCAQMLSDRYLKAEVERLKQWMSGDRDMCRERRLRSFYIINAVLACSTFLPPPNEEPVALMESQVPAMSMPFTNGVRYTVTLDNENMRVALTKLLLQVQARMLADKTDDTRGLEMLLQVWERVVVMKGLRNGPGLEARLRSYGALERAMDGRGGVGGDPAGAARLRMLLADAARLQDEARLDLVCDAGITPSALQALNALYELSINTYSSVRMFAQVRLCWMLSHYPYSYKALVPKISSLLTEGGEGDEWHARHKGALFMILAPRNGPLVAKQDWEVVKALWPAVLNAPLSEKPSILRLQQAFTETIHRHFPTVNTRLTITESAIEKAKYFLKPEQLNEPKFAEQVANALERERQTSDKTEKTYLEFVEQLVDIAETPNIQWRRLELTMQMLCSCPTLKTNYPPRAVKLILNSLIHDDIAVRKIALRLVNYALKQRKRSVKKIEVDPYELAGVEKPEIHVPGYRKDLEWALYSKDRIPQTDEDWEKPWLRNPGFGFYAWPKKLKVAAPPSQQRFSFHIPPEEMEEGERYIHEFFTDETKIDKLVAFLTVEEKKGKDKFNGTRFTVFKLVFSQFGPAASALLLNHAQAHAGSTTESRQRFAAEVAAAAARAPRDWQREPANYMYEQAQQLLQKGLTAVTPETYEDWGTCTATGVEKLDPSRAGNFLEFLLELCAPPPARGDQDPDQDTSFVVCARLYAFQGALSCLTWRAAPLAKELLEKLEAANFTQHPYQNVRETVGSILMTVFDTELIFPGGTGANVVPSLDQWLQSVRPRLAPLYDQNGDMIIKSTSLSTTLAPGGVGGGSPCPPARPPHAPAPPSAVRASSLQDPTTAQSPQPAELARPALRDPPPDKQLARMTSALRLAGDAAPAPASASAAHRDHARSVHLLTTALRVCVGVTVRGVCARAAYVLAGAAAAGGARGDTHNEELPRAAAAFLASLALAHHDPAQFHEGLRTLEELANNRSWWARVSCLDFAQPLLFYALPLLRDNEELARRAERLALTLMKDSRLEVRQSAAKLLTGLMHCRALPDEKKTLRVLMKNSRSKELVERHCGVLGLCAYLASRPYSIVSDLGIVLEQLSRHTNAPDPIPATIRTALADFRRTHNDDWPKHRDQLTQEELDLLADLTSPPSYCT